VARPGLGFAHNDCHLHQRRIVHAVFLQESIKTAKLAYMRHFHAGDVIGSGAGGLRHFHNLVGLNKQEFRLLVYEACDQPETSNSVNFRTLSRDPAYKHSFKNQRTNLPEAILIFQRMPMIRDLR
jgi:hypothetical protein